MQTIWTVILGLSMPLAGTTLGAGMALLIKKEMQPNIQKSLLGFVSGVMITASIWSLLIPAIDIAESAGVIPWLPATIGFLFGVGFLLLLDMLIPHLHLNAN